MSIELLEDSMLGISFIHSQGIKFKRHKRAHSEVILITLLLGHLSFLPIANLYFGVGYPSLLSISLSLHTGNFWFLQVCPVSHCHFNLHSLLTKLSTFHLFLRNLLFFFCIRVLIFLWIVSLFKNAIECEFYSLYVLQIYYILIRI